MEIITGTLAQQQLLDVREAVVGDSGIEREGACLLARLAYEDGECCLKLGAANDIGQERSEGGEAVDGCGGHEFIDSGEVECALACNESIRN